MSGRNPYSPEAKVARSASRLERLRLADAPAVILETERRMLLERAAALPAYMSDAEWKAHEARKSELAGTLCMCDFARSECPLHGMH